MTPCTRTTTVIAALLLCLALPAWSQQLLFYAPQPVTSGQETTSQDGILVQEIEIKKGDTLYALSRKFGGRGMYYPQILLFNSIKNPNLIYTGNTLKVPLRHNEPHVDVTAAKVPHKPKPSGTKHTRLKAETASPALQTTEPAPIASPKTELSISELPGGETVKNKPGRLKKKSAVSAKKPQPVEYPVVTDQSSQLPAAHKSASTTSPSVDSATSGQNLFDAAVSSYRRDDCRTALDQFDLFLADNSGSPLAADANLYKAECYLKLSAQ